MNALHINSSIAHDLLRITSSVVHLLFFLSIYSPSIERILSIYYFCLSVCKLTFGFLHGGTKRLDYTRDETCTRDSTNRLDQTRFFD